MKVQRGAAHAVANDAMVNILVGLIRYFAAELRRRQMASRAFLSLVGEEEGFSPHYHVLLSAKLSTTAADLSVTIRELWTEGAVLEADNLPRAGKDVLLSRGGKEAFGAVTMSRSGRCVVEFEESLDEGDLLLWLHAPGGTAQPMLQPRFDRAGLGKPDFDDKQWNLIRPRDYLARKGAFGD
jgi:hypothetical protein